MKTLPNILTILRIPLSLSLVLLKDHPYLFSFCYLLCITTDFLDGYLARRFSCSSSYGAKLDSIADGFFFAVLFLLLFRYTDLFKDTLTRHLFLGVVFFRIINLAFTYKKFHQFGMLHTWANKTTGLLSILAFPLYILEICNRSWIIAIICVAFFPTLEEFVLLFRLKTYDPDEKGLFF
ncbi:MAG: CDP-alcohol phosphatidyltransferase family protein [Sphaerochaeta sp.]